MSEILGTLPQMSDQYDIVLKTYMEAKKEMGSSVKKDASNTFHKSKYATLAAHLELCEDLLLEKGLVLIPSGNFLGSAPILVSTLIHIESGQWIKTYLPLPNPKNDSQGLGAAVTYMRRYAINSLFNLVAEDDDGETAAGRGKHPDAKKDKQKKDDESKKEENPKAFQMKAEKLDQKNETKDLPRMSSQEAEELYILADQCSPKLIDNIKKHMMSAFGAKSFEQCPENQFRIFKHRMVMDIETPKERAV
jgi:hypothetical protein